MTTHLAPSDLTRLNVPEATRIEVIDGWETLHCALYMLAGMSVYVQDGRRTVKVFAVPQTEAPDNGDEGSDPLDVIRLPSATRIEVIDGLGRQFVRYFDTAGMAIHVQDDRRTIKVFVNRPHPTPQKETP